MNSDRDVMVGSQWVKEACDSSAFIRGVGMSLAFIFMGIFLLVIATIKETNWKAAGKYFGLTVGTAGTILSLWLLWHLPWNVSGWWWLSMLSISLTIAGFSLEWLKDNNNRWRQIWNALFPADRLAQENRLIILMILGIIGWGLGYFFKASEFFYSTSAVMAGIMLVALVIRSHKWSFGYPGPEDPSC